MFFIVFCFISVRNGHREKLFKMVRSEGRVNHIKYWSLASLVLLLVVNAVSIGATHITPQYFVYE